MTLDHARSTILAALGRMNAAYAQPVFDEWVLVSVKQSFTTDIQPLRAELEGGKLTTGDFAFAAAATGTRHDACMRLGGVSYLFCNNTAKSMSDIRGNPLWREAQKPFVELSEKFRADPLE
jgi:hypothetical protein